MIREINAAKSSNAHSDFQKWRSSNTGAPFLVLKTKNIALLHFVDSCWHCGNTSWDDPIAKGLANTEKIVSDTEEEILKYASDRSLIVKRCAHCDN